MDPAFPVEFEAAPDDYTGPYLIEVSAGGLADGTRSAAFDACVRGGGRPGRWWKPGAAGYTDDVFQAGVFLERRDLTARDRRVPLDVVAAALRSATDRLASSVTPPVSVTGAKPFVPFKEIKHPIHPDTASQIERFRGLKLDELRVLVARLRTTIACYDAALNEMPEREIVVRTASRINHFHRLADGEGNIGGHGALTSDDVDELRDALVGAHEECRVYVETYTRAQAAYHREVARSAEVEQALRAELAEARARIPPDEGPTSWATSDPFQTGLEFYDSRTEAETALLEAFHDSLSDTGEGSDEPGYLLAIVGHVQEIRGASSEDDSEEGERLRERGFDYEIEGYTIAPGSGVVVVPRAPSAPPKADT